jgi:hypothetical protein
VTKQSNGGGVLNIPRDQTTIQILLIGIAFTSAGIIALVIANLVTPLLLLGTLFLLTPFLPDLQRSPQEYATITWPQSQSKCIGGIGAPLKLRMSILFIIPILAVSAYSAVDNSSSIPVKELPTRAARQ